MKNYILIFVALFFITKTSFAGFYAQAGAGYSMYSSNMKDRMGYGGGLGYSGTIFEFGPYYFQNPKLKESIDSFDVYSTYDYLGLDLKAKFLFMFVGGKVGYTQSKIDVASNSPNFVYKKSYTFSGPHFGLDCGFNIPLAPFLKFVIEVNYLYTGEMKDSGVIHKEYRVLNGLGMLKLDI